MLKNKKERFYEILKKYGVSEFWCNKDFDLSEEYPCGELYIDCKNTEMKSDLYTLFNESTSEDDLTGIFVGDFSKIDSVILGIMLENSEKRYVVY